MKMITINLSNISLAKKLPLFFLFLYCCAIQLIAQPFPKIIPYSDNLSVLQVPDTYVKGTKSVVKVAYRVSQKRTVVMSLWKGKKWILGKRFIVEKGEGVVSFPIGKDRLNKLKIGGDYLWKFDIVTSSMKDKKIVWRVQVSPASVFPQGATYRSGLMSFSNKDILLTPKQPFSVKIKLSEKATRGYVSLVIKDLISGELVGLGERKIDKADDIQSIPVTFFSELRRDKAYLMTAQLQNADSEYEVVSSVMKEVYFDVKEKDRKKNLVLNSGFELPNMSPWKAGVGKFKIVPSVNAGMGKKMAFVPFHSSIVQVVNIKPNTEYELKANIKAVGSEVSFGVKEFGSIEQHIAVNSHKFMPYSLRFKSGEKNRTAKIFLHCIQKSHGAYIDNVVLEEVSASGGKVRNGKYNRDAIFEKYTSKDGLSQDNVRDVYQDSFGLMWFGTHDGLNKFDGYDFTVYKPDSEKPKSIASNLIYTILEDNHNNIWLRTIGGGVSRFDRATENFHSFYHDPDNPKSYKNGVLKSTFIDREDRLWVSTSTGYASYMQLSGTSKDTVQNFTHIKLPTKWESINAFCLTRDGRMMMASSKGEIYEIVGGLKGEDSEFISHRVTGALGASFWGIGDIRSIAETESGRLVVGTGNGAYYQVKGGRDWEFIPLNVEGAVMDIAIDEAGILWIASSNGVYELSFDKEKHLPQLVNVYQHDPDNTRTISDNNAVSIHIDSKGIVWVGTDKGVNKLNRQRVPFLSFSKNTDTNSLSGYKARAILEDSYGGLWIGLNGSGFLNYKAPRTEKGNYNTFVSLPISDVAALHETTVNGKKVLIVGVATGMNYTIDLKDFTGVHPMNIMKAARTLPFLNGATVNDIAEDKYNQIWVTSYNNGVYKWSANPDDSLYHSPHNYLHAKGHLKAFARCLYIDKNDNLWIGSSKGVRRIKASDLQKKEIDMLSIRHEEANSNSLTNDYVTALAEDDNGNIWVGTLGAGLNKVILGQEGLVDKVFRITESNSGLPNNVVRALGSDDRNNIWVTTNQGISKVNAETIEIKNYDIDDGLQDNHFEDLSYYKTKQGVFYMGGATGVNVFHPDSIYNKTSKPDILFTELKIDNQLVNAGDKINGRVVLDKSIVEADRIEITHKEKSFTIKFAAIHYAAPSKNQYKYKLEGFDKKWIEVDASTRSVTYTNLPHGTYILKVKASNNDNLWNEEGIALQITVIPPWWETWWFRLLVLLSAVSIAFGYYKYRTNLLKKRQKELEKLVDERTSELVSAHQDLQMKHEEVQTQAEELVQQAEELQTQRDHLEQKTQVILEKNSLIETLSEIGREITSSIEVDNIVHTIYNHLCKLIDVEYFELGVLDGKLSRVAFYGFHDSNQMIRNNSDIRVLNKEYMTFSQWVVLNKRAVVINNIDKDLDKHPSIDRKKYLGQKYKSILYYPLIVGDNLVGIMVLKSVKKAVFDSKLLSILESITDYASISMENARAYSVIQDTTEHVTSSIRYAQTIQEAMLPFDEAFRNQFNSFFTLFRPKDIVSGDFYWMSEHEDRVFVAVVDCTGHGVPGAFMSMIGSSILNRIVKEQKIYNTDRILDLLDVGIRKALKQEQSKNDDGMDLVLCCFHKDQDGKVTKVLFTGAKNSIYHYTSSEHKLREIKGDRRAIGGAVKRKKKAFTCQEISVSEGDAIYLLTDGILDQNRADRARFGKVKLQELLFSNSQMSMAEQYENIAKELDAFQGDEEQRDDITLIGIRI